MFFNFSTVHPLMLLFIIPTFLSDFLHLNIILLQQKYIVVESLQNVEVAVFGV